MLETQCENVRQTQASHVRLVSYPFVMGRLTLIS